MDIAAERRQLPRIEVDWSVTVFTDKGPLEGESKNITPDGLYIQCDQPLPLNNTFRLSINPPDHQSIGVTGRVVWSDTYGIYDGEEVFGIGICLVEISKNDRKFLKDLISPYL